MTYFTSCMNVLIKKVKEIAHWKSSTVGEGEEGDDVNQCRDTSSG